MKRHGSRSKNALGAATASGQGIPRSFVLFCALLFIGLRSAHAHHGSHSSPGMQVLPGGGLMMDQSVSSISLSEEWYKGDRPEPEEPVRIGANQVTPVAPPRNLWISTLTMEHAFHPRFSAFLALPVQAFDRKDAPDYARLGRITLGGRSPVVQGLFGGGFVVVDGAVGFPSGSDHQVATHSDFWSGALGVTVGWQTSRWQIFFRSDGQWPLSHLDREEEESELEKTARYLNGNFVEPASTEHHSLRKVTTHSIEAAYFIVPSVGLALGGLYQDPFQGIVRDDRVSSPRIYRELSVSTIVRVAERWILLGKYRYPLERGNDRKRFEEIYSVSATYAFTQAKSEKKGESESATKKSVE